MSNYLETYNQHLLISTDPAKLDVDIIYHFLSKESYWAQGISRDVAERSLMDSICFGLYDGNRQIGFARVISDTATFAYLADVFILTQYRGKGLSKWLMKTIHEHPELQNLRRWWLGTKYAHGLYEQFGWTRITDDAARRFMQLHNPDVYKKGSIDHQSLLVILCEDYTSSKILSYIQLRIGGKKNSRLRNDLRGIAEQILAI